MERNRGSEVEARNIRITGAPHIDPCITTKSALNVSSPHDPFKTHIGNASIDLLQDDTSIIIDANYIAATSTEGFWRTKAYNKRCSRASYGGAHSRTARLESRAT